MCSLIREFHGAYDDIGEQKVAIITGGTSGIGKEMVKAVAKAGFHVVLPVRNRAKGERVKSEIIQYAGDRAMVTLMDCDMSSLASVKAFANSFKSMNFPISLLISTHIDIISHPIYIIDNAGVFYHETKKTTDGFESNMGINYISHYALTEELLPVIEAKRQSSYGCRIINVSSASFYSVTTLNPSELYSKHWWERFAPYARSKFAQVMYTKELARRINAAHITINCMEPGMVKTDIYRYDPVAVFFFQYVMAVLAPFLLLKPEEGAVTAIWLALSPDVHAISGKVFSDLHEIPVGTAVANIMQMQPDLVTSITDQALLRLQ